MIIPILIDGFQTIGRLFVTLAYAVFGQRKKTGDNNNLQEYQVSVIIPAYNEEVAIDRCINSLKIQTYPHHLVEIIAVDDGSEDRTVEKVNDHVNGNGNGNGDKNGNGNGNGNGKVKINGNSIPVGDFGGVMKLITKSHQGKAKALNAGIKQASGDLILCIDSDVTLAPDALEEVARYFHQNEDVDAATAHLEIDSRLLLVRDSSGDPELDENEETISREMTWFEEFLANSQFFEYLNSFRIGRQAEAVFNGVFTLAGATSVFRANTIKDDLVYQDRTVSEDTDLTLSLHRRGGKIGYMPNVKVYLEPVVDWDELYAQRVRWQRGELEVFSYHKDFINSRGSGYFGRWQLPLRLQTDHTMAFLRLIWTFLLPLFPFIGYPSSTILWVFVIMYGLYVLIEYLHIGVSFLLIDKDSRNQVVSKIAWGILMPIYRLFTFYCRMSGALVTLREPPRWRRLGPAERFRNGKETFKLGLARGWKMVLGVLTSFIRMMAR